MHVECGSCHTLLAGLGSVKSLGSPPLTAAMLDNNAEVQKIPDFYVEP